MRSLFGTRYLSLLHATHMGSILAALALAGITVLDSPGLNDGHATRHK